MAAVGGDEGGGETIGFSLCSFKFAYMTHVSSTILLLFLSLSYFGSYKLCLFVFVRLHVCKGHACAVDMLVVSSGTVRERPWVVGLRGGSQREREGEGVGGHWGRGKERLLYEPATKLRSIFHWKVATLVLMGQKHSRTWEKNFSFTLGIFFYKCKMKLNNFKHFFHNN